MFQENHSIIQSKGSTSVGSFDVSLFSFSLSLSGLACASAEDVSDVRTESEAIEHWQETQKMVVVGLADERVYVDSIVWKVAVGVWRVVNDERVCEVLIYCSKIFCIILQAFLNAILPEKATLKAYFGIFLEHITDSATVELQRSGIYH